MSGIACHLGPSPEGRHRFAYVSEDITDAGWPKRLSPSRYGSRNTAAMSAWHSPKTPRWDGCYTAVAEAMVRHLHAAFARIWMLEGAEDALILQASAGIDTHLDGPHGRIPVGCGEIGLIAQDVRPRLTNDVADDPRIYDREWLGARASSPSPATPWSSRRS